MNKVKVLKESGCVTEKEMATALEPFFVHNPVIMDSFKALFPSIYRPQSMYVELELILTFVQSLLMQGLNVFSMT